MEVPSSRVSNQACSSELDPGELSSNGLHSNRGLLHVGPLGLKAHAPRNKTLVFKGSQIFQGITRRPGVRQRFGRITVGNAHLLTSHPVGCCLCYGYLFLSFSVIIITLQHLADYETTAFKGVNFGRPWQVREEGVPSSCHSKSGRSLLGSAIQKCSLPPR